MTKSYSQIRLKKGKERSLLQRHPWVFSGAIATEPEGMKEGEIVHVVSSEGDFLALGHFHKGNITVRCFHFEEVPADDSLFREKIRAAYALRKLLGFPNERTDCFRLIHGEGDGFPGLVADVYGNTVVLQAYTSGMFALLPSLAELLPRELPFVHNVYNKSKETLGKHGIVALEDRFLKNASETNTGILHVRENEMELEVDIIRGQKTGFFLDQRDNRSLLRHYSMGKSVLNTFCYTGGFTVAALAGGARLVHSVDSSARAMEALEKNVAIAGGHDRHEGFTSDVMRYMKACTESYDIVVLDPPAYAKHLSQVSQAMIGYRNLNTEGFKHVSKGGLLFTFSCSQAVDSELFRKLVFQSALQAGRNARILHRLSQPPDHPVSIYHPEAEYLKGLVLVVD